MSRRFCMHALTLVSLLLLGGASPGYGEPGATANSSTIEQDVAECLRLFKTGTAEDFCVALRVKLHVSPSDSAFNAMAEKVASMRKQVPATYGKPLGEVELVRKETMGESLLRLTYVERCANNLATWRFLFIRPERDWRIHSITLDKEPPFMSVTSDIDDAKARQTAQAAMDKLRTEDLKGFCTILRDDLIVKDWFDSAEEKLETVRRPFSIHLGKPLGKIEYLGKVVAGHSCVRYTFLEMWERGAVAWSLVFYRAPDNWHFRAFESTTEIDMAIPSSQGLSPDR